MAANTADHPRNALAGLGEAAAVTSANIGDFVTGLPAKARMTLHALLGIRVGSLTLRTPEGSVLTFKGAKAGPNAVLILNNWNLPGRAMAGGTIGVAESYMDGDWESPDVTSFIELFVANNHVGQKLAGTRSLVLSTVHKLRHWLNANTKWRAKKNIAAHYDLGNDFYRLWLDPSMTYSSALFSTGANDLESAQHEKYRALAKATGIRPGDHVLEIGCGWGGFAEFAARELDCRLTCLTISKEQLAYAKERIERAGLSDKVEFRFQDYRDETGVYDRIVSIEMFEAVGEKYWDTYFRKVRECLAPGGKAGLQIITIREEAWDIYKATPDFIQHYIFPGGMLPTPAHLMELGKAYGMALAPNKSMAFDYARTLAEWRERFWSAWEDIRPLGFDDRFRRMWEFYLHYCEAGFRAGNTDVRQFIFSR